MMSTGHCAKPAQPGSAQQAEAPARRVGARFSVANIRLRHAGAKCGMEKSHVPVMLDEALAGLNIDPGGNYFDGTFGRGGHAAAILRRLGADGRLYAMDKDPDAIAHAERTFGADARVRIRQGSFADLGAWRELPERLDGALLDLGVSSPQLDSAARGFSFMHDGPLDMRMDRDRGLTAAQWLASAQQEEIADVLFQYGEERQSRRIAAKIVAERLEAPLATTRQLAALVGDVLGFRPGSHHPATRTFQALRIFVNRELDDLKDGLSAIAERLKPGGRLVVISFHSLEDRIVKRFMRGEARQATMNRRMPVAPAAVERKISMVGKAQKPADAETACNPRARSAVLRIAERAA